MKTKNLFYYAFWWSFLKETYIIERRAGRFLPKWGDLASLVGRRESHSLEKKSKILSEWLLRMVLDRKSAQGSKIHLSCTSFLNLFFRVDIITLNIVSVRGVTHWTWAKFLADLMNWLRPPVAMALSHARVVTFPKSFKDRSYMRQGYLLLGHALK